MMVQGKPLTRADREMILRLALASPEVINFTHISKEVGCHPRAARRALLLSLRAMMWRLQRLGLTVKDFA